MAKIIALLAMLVIGCVSNQPEPQDSELVIIDGHEYFKCGESAYFHNPDCAGCKSGQN